MGAVTLSRRMRSFPSHCFDVVIAKPDGVAGAIAAARAADTARWQGVVHAYTVCCGGALLVDVAGAKRSYLMCRVQVNKVLTKREKKVAFEAAQASLFQKRQQHIIDVAEEKASKADVYRRQMKVQLSKLIIRLRRSRSCASICRPTCSILTVQSRQRACSGRHVCLKPEGRSTLGSPAVLCFALAAIAGRV
eukprot:SAG11_NODE_560_length_8528_cov_4.697710_11_plen_192_part_00